jgi:hypothetical protein
MTAMELYVKNASEPSDIGAHMAYMFKLASECDRIVEFGVRGGISTSVWLHSKPEALTCYDMAVPALLDDFKSIALLQDTAFHFVQDDTSKLEDIPDCDLLFLDTLHAGPQVAAELKHSYRVSKYIVLHDTETNGWSGEGGRPGIKVALIDFLLDNPQWRIKSHHKECNGLTVLERTHETRP